MARQARGFFERLIDFKIENDLLVVHPSPGLGSSGNLHTQASNAFPNIGEIRVRYARGSTSMHRGSGGSVQLSFEADGSPGSFSFRLVSPDGGETMLLSQTEPGSLTLEYTSASATVSYSQTRGKCQLKIKARGGRLSVTKKGFGELFGEGGDIAQKHFIGLLDAFFDKVPFAYVFAAPPGKVIFHLKGDALVVGEVKGPDLSFETAYGPLKLPWSEIRQITFPEDKPEDVVVTMQRFTPKGKLDVDVFEVTTAYGLLRVQTSDVREVFVGPPVVEK